MLFLTNRSNFACLDSDNLQVLLRDIPDEYPLAKAAPLLCAGITVYAPMKRPSGSSGTAGLATWPSSSAKRLGSRWRHGGAQHERVQTGRLPSTCMLGADSFVMSSDKQQTEVLLCSAPPPPPCTAHQRSRSVYLLDMTYHDHVYLVYFSDEHAAPAGLPALQRRHRRTRPPFR